MLCPTLATLTSAKKYVIGDCHQGVYTNLSKAQPLIWIETWLEVIWLHEKY